jgi:hypothetical protein
LAEPEIKTIARAAGVELVAAGKRHARELGRTARLEDRAEVWASGRMTPEQAARASINRSYEAWAGYAGGDLLGVFGVSLYRNSPWAAPWVISSTFVDRHPLTFWRASKAILAYYRGKYPKMVQMIDSHYRGALDWADKLGFRLEGPEPFGWQGTLFCRISMETPKLIVEVR